MATALKLRSDIKKLKKALETKGISASIKDKLKGQLDKAETELAKLQKPKSSAKKSTSSLQKIVKKKNYGAYQGQGVDLKKDADRPAKPSGKRKSKFGNTYYEYRANRIDVKQPPKRYPKLEDGGYMAKGGEIGEIYTKMYRDAHQEKQFNKRLDKARELDNYAKKNKIEIDNNYVIFVDGEKIGYINKINQKTGQEKTNWDFVKFADGGYMAEGGGVNPELKGELYDLVMNMDESEYENLCSAYDIDQYEADEMTDFLHTLNEDKTKKMLEEIKNGKYKLSLGQIRDKYKQNEHNNLHSENVVLLAEHFGNDSDLRDAKTILAKHEAIGHMPSSLSDERHILDTKLYARFMKQLREKGSNGTPEKMSYGGETHRYENGGYMAEGGEVIHLKSVSAWFKPSDMTVSPEKDFKNEGEITHIDDVDDEWFEKLSDYDLGTIQHYINERTTKGQYANGGYMAKGGFVAVGEKDGYWTIMSKPTTKEMAQKVIDMGVPRGEVGKVVSVIEAKAHKKTIGAEYLEYGGYMAEGGVTGNDIISYLKKKRINELKSDKEYYLNNSPIVFGFRWNWGLLPMSKRKELAIEAGVPSDIAKEMAYNAQDSSDLMFNMGFEVEKNTKKVAEYLEKNGLIDTSLGIERPAAVNDTKRQMFDKKVKDLI